MNGSTVSACIVACILLGIPALGTAASVETHPDTLTERSPRPITCSTRKGKPRRLDIYKPNYILSGFERGTQVSFQFSFRYDLWPSDQPVSVFLGYTQRSFWDIYNGSSPFAENNYSPELFVRWNFNSYQLVNGFDQLLLGWQHESNGRAGETSRSWDRVYIEQRYVQFLGAVSRETPVLRAYLRLWIIAEATENPDVYDYSGPGELILDLSSGQTDWGEWDVEFVGRLGGANLQSEKGKVQLGMRWQPPWPENVRLTPGLYLQAYFGHMESLQTYNRSNRSVRLGVVFPG